MQTTELQLALFISVFDKLCRLEFVFSYIAASVAATSDGIIDVDLLLKKKIHY